MRKVTFASPSYEQPFSSATSWRSSWQLSFWPRYVSSVKEPGEPRRNSVEQRIVAIHRRTNLTLDKKRLPIVGCGELKDVTHNSHTTCNSACTMTVFVRF